MDPVKAREIILKMLDNYTDEEAIRILANLDKAFTREDGLKSQVATALEKGIWAIQCEKL